MSEPINPSQPDSKGKQRATEILEVEDEDQRHERIQDLFSKLNAPISTPGNPGPSVLDPSRPFDFGDRSTFPVGPPIGLLSRVQAFLPELAASNADLIRRAKEDPTSVDIENVGENELQYIEMNLGLGVFEPHGAVPPDIPVADVHLEDVRMDDSIPTSNSNSDSDSDSGSDSDGSTSSSSSSSDVSSTSDSDSGSNADSVLSPSTVRPIKPLPKRSSGPVADSKPEIVVLSSSNDLGS